MRIEYLGHSCFRLTTKTGITVVTDPYRGVGYELPENLRADILTVSHGHFDHNNVAAVKNPYAIVSEAKTYTYGDVTIEGIGSDHDPLQGKLRGKNVIYKITADGVTVCHLGDLGEEYNEKLVEKIGQCDVLLIPVGGTYTIDAKAAKIYADAIAPKTVIPMHFRPSDGSLDIADEREFLSLYPAEQIASVKNGCVELPQKSATAIIFMERMKA